MRLNQSNDSSAATVASNAPTPAKTAVTPVGRCFSKAIFEPNVR
jgi:hypothetical protein